MSSGRFRGRAAAVAMAVSLMVMAACGDRSAPGEADRTAEVGGAPAGAETPPPAEEVVADAVRTAHEANKAVLIEFGASWCTWCTNFQTFVHSPDAGRVITDNFVVVTLIVREADDKKTLEHPGGSELMTKWGGAESGLPFYVLLDAEGGKVGDSNAMPDGSNIGYPVTEVEIAQFMGLLDRTAPRLTPADRTTILAYLEKAARP